MSRSNTKGVVKATISISILTVDSTLPFLPYTGAFYGCPPRQPLMCVKHNSRNLQRGMITITGCPKEVSFRMLLKPENPILSADGQIFPWT